ncbi:lamin tail domain-containing protein [Candidatus Dependentiae bacterium]|nr:lamin tail domain-containing protein [Candidatus Dependentiae bacterium]
MKNSFRIFSVIVGIFLLTIGMAYGDLIISEVCDHQVAWAARYVEIYNPTDNPIDLTNYTLNRYAGTSLTPATFTFTGTIASGEALVVASSATEFNNQFGFDPDWSNGSVITGNGDDTYELCFSGTGIDIYGEIGVDGTGEPWEYLDDNAIRAQTVCTGTTTWTASEWTITPGVGTCDPRNHVCDCPAGACNPDTTAPDWTVSGVANLVVTDPATSGELDLDWDDATDADNPTTIKYAVYRDTSSGFSPGAANRIATGLSTSAYADSGLSDGTPYYYRIETYDCAAQTRYNTDEGSGTPTAPVPDTIYSVQFNNTIQGTDPDCFPSTRDAEVGVTLQGIVSAITGGHFYIAESSAPWHSIYVYNSGEAPLVGDLITLTGEVDEYNGLTEMKNLSYYNVDSSGNPVHGPYTITCETYGGSGDWGAACDANTESIEGSLVTLYNVEVSSEISKYNYWRIKDQGGTLHFGCDDTYYDPAGDIINGRQIDQITGIITYGYGYYRLNPRDAGDIIFAGCNPDTTAPDWTVSTIANLVVTDPGSGGALNLDWDNATDADNPTTIKYAVYRDTSSGFVPGAANRIATDLTNSDYADSGLVNGTPYYYRIETYDCAAQTRYNTDEGSGTPTLISYNPGDIVINEFYPKGTEWIELYNTTGGPIDVGNWTVFIDSQSDSDLTGILSPGLTVPAGGFLVIDKDSISNVGHWDGTDMDNDGAKIYLRQSAVDIDVVGFGIEGSAPLAPSNFTIARVLDGIDTDDDAVDFNITGGAVGSVTKGTTNNGSVPAVSLGTTVVINELDRTPAVGNDKIEIYNPTGVAIDMTGFFFSDGDGYLPLTSTPIVPAGGFVVLEEGIDFASGPEIGSTDVAYLFNAVGVRLDQLGVNGETENETFQRVPDGAGPHDGYNWLTSGGCTTYFDVPETLGATNGTNVPPAQVTNLADHGIGFTYVTLTWTAPGDDSNCSGTAQTYDVRYTVHPTVLIEGNWNAATQVTGEPTPSIQGTSEKFTVMNLTSDTTYYFGIKTQDTGAAWSDISNVVSVHTGVIFANDTDTKNYTDPGDDYHYINWEVNVRFHNNSGAETASNITVEIVDCTDWVIVDDPTSVYPDIGPGAELWSDELIPFQFDLTNRPPATNYINVWFDVTYSLAKSGNVFERVGVTIEIPKSSPVPHNITAKSVDDGVKLDWDAVDGSDGYNVYKLINDTWTKINGNLITDTSYLDKNVTAGVEYSYKITSIASGIESGYSETVKVVFTEDYETLDEIVTYPNPAKDKVIFDKLPKGSKIDIYTMTGELVYSMTVRNAKSEWHLINAAGRKVGNGIYFYVVKHNGNLKTGKIAIVR